MTQWLIVSYHLRTMTGCDVNSGYYGKVKGMLFDKLSDRAKQLLQHCGEDEETEEECIRIEKR